MAIEHYVKHTVKYETIKPLVLYISGKLENLYFITTSYLAYILLHLYLYLEIVAFILGLNIFLLAMGLQGKNLIHTCFMQ